MKKILILLLLSLGFISLVSAHSGRTDSSGGHNNRSTGTYHYHNSGSSSSSSYSGNCPCPYDIASDGSSCGARSAWSRSGGASPICYSSGDSNYTYKTIEPPKGSELTKVNDTSATNVFIYTDTIKEHEGYVYWWELTDYLKPLPWGDMSAKTYVQGDCEVIRFKTLSYIFYKEPMGRGSGDRTPTTDEWTYPLSGRIHRAELDFACDYVGRGT